MGMLSVIARPLLVRARTNATRSGHGQPRISSFFWNPRKVRQSHFAAFGGCRGFSRDEGDVVVRRDRAHRLRHGGLGLDPLADLSSRRRDAGYAFPINSDQLFLAESSRSCAGKKKTK